MGDDQAACLLHRLEKGLLVQGHDAPKIHDFRLDPLLGQGLGRFQGFVQGGGIGYDGDVGAFPHHLALPNWYQKIPLGHRALHAKEVLVLKVQDRIIRPDGRFQEPLGIGGIGRNNYLQAWDMDEPGLQALGVLGSGGTGSAVGSP